MKVFASCSGGASDRAEKYLEYLRASGHTVLSGSAKQLAAAEALFCYIAGSDHADVKADLNMALSKGLPVACVVEEGAVLDRGLEMQLGLALKLPREGFEEQFGDWLASCADKEKKGKQKKVLIACAVALALIVAVFAILHFATGKQEEEPQPAPSQTVDYFDGADPASVTVLDLSGRGLAKISFLEEAVNLEELNLSGNAVSDISPLASLTKLRRLDLSNNEITDINALLTLKALEWVDISGNEIEDATALDFLEGVEIVQ